MIEKLGGMNTLFEVSYSYQIHVRHLTLLKYFYKDVPVVSFFKKN